MSVRLFVGNLPYDVTEPELREFFKPVGRLSRVFLPVDRETGKQRGFAFIEFGSQSEADDAIARMNDQSFKGRAIAVKEARERENRVPGGNNGPSASRPGMSRPGMSRPGMSQPGFSGSRSAPRTGGPGPGSRGTATVPMEEVSQKRRSRNFGGPARPDRKRRIQTRPHKSEWGRKSLLRDRFRNVEDEDLDLMDDSQDDLMEEEVFVSEQEENAE